MSKNTVKRLFSAVLAVIMLVSVTPLVNAGAKPTIYDPENNPEEWAKYVAMFTEKANSIKKDTPYCVVSNESGLAENGIKVEYGGDGNAYDEEVDAKVEKWLSPVFDGMFKSNSSVALSFIETLLGKGFLGLDTRTFYKNENRDKYVPLFGEDVVSRLTPDDKDFELTVSYDSEDPDRLLGIRVMYYRDDVNTGEESSMDKVFSISDGTIDPIIISGNNSSATKLDVKFKDFKYGTSKVNLYFDENGDVERYISEVPYEFSVSLYDLLNVFDAVNRNFGFTFSFAQMGIKLANTILTNLGKDSITAESVLSDYSLRIRYIVRTVVSDFNFAPRIFGDIDGDGKVTVDDARAALRHAVQLDTIKTRDGLIYGDVNFDGVIDINDARAILRMSVKLDPTFTEVPAGKKITIVSTEPETPDTPDTPETPDTPDTPDNPETPKPDYSDLELFPASVAQTIFDIINFIGGSTDSFIDYIKAIIAASKK